MSTGLPLDTFIEFQKLMNAYHPFEEKTYAVSFSKSVHLISFISSEFYVMSTRCNKLKWVTWVLLTLLG